MDNLTLVSSLDNADPIRSETAYRDITDTLLQFFLGHLRYSLPVTAIPSCTPIPWQSPAVSMVAGNHHWFNPARLQTATASWPPDAEGQSSPPSP